VLNNLGNYKSFGDTKFVPRLPVNEFQKVIDASSSLAKVEALKIFQKIKDVIYSLDPESSCLIGYPGEGHVSGYYSSNVSKKDVDLV
jgi:dipeptidyl-peptidase-3